MERKTLHLICNAHIDPVWQWDWEEGAAEAVSTFRCAADFCETFDGFVFCHNEAQLYEWIEEYEPALFARIGKLIGEGKWHVMGGWQLQPDCNMPSGEAIFRNLLTGRRYFVDRFGVKPTTAINFDPFGHSRGLVQILVRSGYDSYMFMRPDEGFCHLPADLFEWVGYDGSSVMGARAVGGYNSGRGNAIEKVRGFAHTTKEGNAPVNFCLWGVGNHGGGPSRKDIADIEAAMPDFDAAQIQVLHSTPEGFFADVKARSGALPRHEGDLNRWAVGCYTSQIRVKQKYRQLEDTYFFCEKLLTRLSLIETFPYPETEMEQALHDLLFVQFHDALPGSSIQPVEESCLRILDHGLEILSRLRARAFFAMCKDQKPAREGSIPILCCNPHPYPVEGDFTVEFMLADQNWSGTFTLPIVKKDGEEIPCQVEKEDSNIPLDWRKRVCFRAVLAPMQITRFDCDLIQAEKPIPSLPETDDHILFDSGRMQVKINRTTGLVDALVADGISYLANGALSIDIYADSEDPWGMTISGWHEKIGTFTLLDEEKGTKLSALPARVPSVRIVEDGAVRSVIEAVFGYGDSAAVVRYILSKNEPSLDLSLRIRCAETRKLFKLRFPFDSVAADGVAQVIFGEEPLVKGGIENSMQRYVRLFDDAKSMTVLNKGSYGCSMEENDLLISLLRTAAYTAHPIGDKPILPTHHHSAWIEQGERLFAFSLRFGKRADAREAQVYGESPMILSFFPCGEYVNAQPAKAPFALSDDAILVSAFKPAMDKNGTILRLFNPEKRENDTTLTLQGGAYPLRFSPFEIKTLRLVDGDIIPCAMTEEPLV